MSTLSHTKATLPHNNTPSHRLLPLLLGLGLALGASTAQAADAFTEAVQKTYGPYRAALFKTNSGSQADSREALAQARQAWQALANGLGKQPPAPYDRDAGVGRTLDAVAAIYARAATEIEAGDLARAHETLEAVRDQIAEMRHRNQVVVFSDHMNAYHAQMEIVLKEGPGLLNGTPRWVDLAWMAGTLDHLMQRMVAEAGPAAQAPGEFKDLVDAVKASVTRLGAAVRQQDAVRAREALGQIKPPYSKLFLKFG